MHTLCNRENFDYYFGIHSNIPHCCVIWYQDKKNAGYTNIGQTFRPEYVDNYWGISYVPCDACDVKIKEGLYLPNKVHYCDRNNPAEECKRFLQELYDYN